MLKTQALGFENLDHPLVRKSLSCVFCVFAGRREFVLAARLNPVLLQDYIAVEQQVRSDFKHSLSMKDIAAAAASPP